MGRTETSPARRPHREAARARARRARTPSRAPDARVVRESDGSVPRCTRRSAPSRWSDTAESGVARSCRKLLRKRRRVTGSGRISRGAKLLLYARRGRSPSSESYDKRDIRTTAVSPPPEPSGRVSNVAEDAPALVRLRGPGHRRVLALLHGQRRARALRRDGRHRAQHGAERARSGRRRRAAGGAGRRGALHPSGQGYDLSRFQAGRVRAAHGARRDRAGSPDRARARSPPEGRFRGGGLRAVGATRGRRLAPGRCRAPARARTGHAGRSGGRRAARHAPGPRPQPRPHAVARRRQPPERARPRHDRSRRSRAPRPRRAPLAAARRQPAHPHAVRRGGRRRSGTSSRTGRPRGCPRSRTTRSASSPTGSTPPPRGYEERARALEERDIQASVNEMLAAAATVNDLAGFGSRVLEKILQVSGASSAVLYLPDGSGEFRRSVATGGDVSPEDATGRAEAVRAAREGRPIYLSVDPQRPTINLFDGRILPRESVHIPLIYFDHAVGVLALGAMRAFTPRTTTPWPPSRRASRSPWPTPRPTSASASSPAAWPSRTSSSRSSAAASRGRPRSSSGPPP